MVRNKDEKELVVEVSMYVEEKERFAEVLREVYNQDIIEPEELERLLKAIIRFISRSMAPPPEAVKANNLYVELSVYRMLMERGHPLETVTTYIKEGIEEFAEEVDILSL